MRSTRTALAIALCSLLSLPAWALESPTQTLRQANERLTKLLNKKTTPGSRAAEQVKDGVKKEVNQLLDYEELAKLSLGKHWKDRSDKARTEFTGLLRDLIERNYVKQLRSNLGHKIEYKGETLTGDTALVSTVVRVEKKGRVTEVAIDYKMKKQSTRWMVFDVVTDEVSIVQNYRSQFNRIIRKESYDALVKKKKRKLEETNESKAT